MRVLTPDGEELASWPVEGAGAPSLAVVDEIARLLLAGRRLGGDVVVVDADPRVLELLALAGLA